MSDDLRCPVNPSHRVKWNGGDVVCMECPPTDEEIIDWWEWYYADDWERQMAEFGYAVLKDDDDRQSTPGDRVALIAESHWVPSTQEQGISRLWDRSTPSRVGFRGPKLDARTYRKAHRS